MTKYIDSGVSREDSIPDGTPARISVRFGPDRKRNTVILAAQGRTREQPSPKSHAKPSKGYFSAFSGGLHRNQDQAEQNRCKTDTS